MPRLSPHLIFDGQCEAAFKFYESCLGGKTVMMMTYGSAPGAEQSAPEWRDKILHGTFAVGENRFSGADVPPDRYRKPQGFYLILEVGDSAEADRIFNTMAEKGTVQMPMQETFWALRFGIVIDQFGTPWEINCGKPA